MDEHTRLRILEIENEHLKVALERRDIIGQAKGILMERGGLDADAAVDYLVRRSQREQVHLIDIACRVTDSRALTSSN